MAKTKTNLHPGDIYAVPLFLKGVSPLQSFARDNFQDRGDDFAFIRIIEDRHGSGYLIEAFALTGGLGLDVHSIINGERLFRPVPSTGLGPLKKRWKLIGRHHGYDKEKHSGYSDIQLVLGSSENNPRLWQNGMEKPISKEEIKAYESWTIWMPHQIEQRIVSELTIRGLWPKPQ